MELFDHHRGAQPCLRLLLSLGEPRGEIPVLSRNPREVLEYERTELSHLPLVHHASRRTEATADLMQQLREYRLLVWVAPQPALDVAERLPERVGVTSKSIESLPDGGEYVEYDPDIWAVDHAAVIHQPRMSARHLAVGLHFRERGPPAEAAQPRPPRPHFCSSFLGCITLCVVCSTIAGP